MAILSTNLEKELSTLQANLTKCQFSGFVYAPAYAASVAEGIIAETKRVVFDFEDSTTKLSNNSTAASLGQIGNIELDVFRKNDSPCRLSGAVFGEFPGIEF